MAVFGPGLMPLFAAEALLRRLPDTVHLRLVRPAPPALRQVLGPESLDPADALLRQLLTEPRVEVVYGGPSQDDKAGDSTNADAVVRVGTALSPARQHHPDTVLAGVVSPGELRRRLRRTPESCRSQSS